MGIDVICLTGATRLAPDCPTGRAVLLSRGGTARRCSSAPCFWRALHALLLGPGAPRRARRPSCRVASLTSVIVSPVGNSASASPCATACCRSTPPTRPTRRASKRPRHRDAVLVRDRAAVIRRPAGRRSGRADGRLDAVGLHGARHGEALPLRRVDIDFDAAHLSVRRSVGVVEHKGQGEEIVLGAGPGSSTWTPPRSLRRRHTRGPKGRWPWPAMTPTSWPASTAACGTRAVSRRFVAAVAVARESLGADTPSVIRL